MPNFIVMLQKCARFISIAQDYPGGRVMTEIVQNGVIELGAQWAHVSTSRMVEFAKEFGLASPIESSEGSGWSYK